MSKEDRIRFSFLLIITVIVMTMNIHAHAEANRRGLRALDMIFDDYLTSTASQWAAAHAAESGIGFVQSH
ncbi:MAG: hypothetical protein Q4D58_11700 [Synergistaceae bacterium]|nr:hypothetical protein [Synergistaceae bacterium]